MVIKIHEFYKDPLKALNGDTNLQDELEYHFREYGVFPKTVHILPYWANGYKYKSNKNTMIIFPS